MNARTLAAVLLFAIAAPGCGGCNEPEPAAPTDAPSTATAAPAATTGAASESKGAGKLTVSDVDQDGHKIFDANGKEVGLIDPAHAVVDLPAGIYAVAFGALRWPSVEVKPSETTTLTPGILQLDKAWLNHVVKDSSTGVEGCQLNPVKHRCTLLPGTYEVSFGQSAWKDVRIEAGKTTALEPGVIEKSAAASGTIWVLDAAGKTVEALHAVQHRLPVPPGTYHAEIDGKTVEVTVKEGETKAIP